MLELRRYQEYLGATPGEIWFEGKRVAHSLELPWLDNAESISCIPLGRYRLVVTMSNRFKKPLPLIPNVGSRTGIRLHAANHTYELEGCIAVVTGLGILDNEVVGYTSQEAMVKLMVLISKHSINSINITKK